MAPDQLRQMLRIDPFRPFRIHLSGGASYDVTGPELLVVATRTSALAVPGRGGEDDLVLLDNLHITHAEPLTMVDRA